MGMRRAGECGAFTLDGGLLSSFEPLGKAGESLGQRHQWLEEIAVSLLLLG
jgi:hypothetical protein